MADARRAAGQYAELEVPREASVEPEGGRFGPGDHDEQRVVEARPLRARRMNRTMRVAIVGSAASVAGFREALTQCRQRRYELVGRIAPERVPGVHRPPGLLGHTEALGTIVEEHQIELILLAGDTPRIAVFEQLIAARSVGRVRLQDLAAFCETNFGYIPMTEINAAWFQCLLHPNYRPPHARVKRVFDIVFALAVALAVLPALALAAVAVKLGGGPVLYKQRRVGEDGRLFWLYKLRTMHAEADETARWCAADDPRVTPVGRVLRRLHVDELPQLYNVLRGDMSIVGPRPEQPALVAELEHTLPFYDLRHLVKPGLTGWAQIRCGYAGSHHGSRWKLCHDLYYLKRRSVLFDLAILLETVWTVIWEGRHLGMLPGPRLNLAVAQAEPAVALGDGAAAMGIAGDLHLANQADEAGRG